MKRISYSLMACLVGLCFIFMGCKQTPKSVEPLSVNGTFLVNSQGEKVVLQGVSFGWHQLWPRFYNAKAVDFLVNDWGAEVVRASMGIDLEEADSAAYLKKPQHGLDCVTRVADAAIEQGSYVIIDWHSHHLYQEEAKNFFRQMATRYKGIPNVIYEIYNEPIDDSWDTLKVYSVDVINAIREIEPNAVILVGCPHWDQDIHLVAESPIKDQKNIMYTMHFYANTHRQWLRDRCDTAIAAGIPIFVSECAGMEASGNGPVDLVEWNKWVAWMNANSISYAAWSISDKNESCSMLIPAASSEGNWKDDQIKEWGKIVRAEMNKNKK